MEDFEKIIKDFTKDLLISFPELKDDLHKDIETVCLDKEDKNDALAGYMNTQVLFFRKDFLIFYMKIKISGLTIAKIIWNSFPV